MDEEEADALFQPRAMASRIAADLWKGHYSTIMHNVVRETIVVPLGEIIRNFPHYPVVLLQFQKPAIQTTLC